MHGSEPNRLKYLLHPYTPKKALKELARGTIAEHDLFLLLDAAQPVEDEQAFVHTVEQFDVLLVRKLELGVQLADVDDNYTSYRQGEEEKEYHEDAR